METSASFEARSAPSSYPTDGHDMRFGHERLDAIRSENQPNTPAAGIDPDSDTDADPEGERHPSSDTSRIKVRQYLAFRGVVSRCEA
jgi:hypothetical protein